MSCTMCIAIFLEVGFPFSMIPKAIFAQIFTASYLWVVYNTTVLPVVHTCKLK